MPEYGGRPRTQIIGQEVVSARQGGRASAGVESTTVGVDQQALAVTGVEAESSAVVQQLEIEIQRLKRDNLLDRLNLPPSAEEKLEKLQSVLLELTHLSTQIIVELYQRDPKHYLALIAEIQEKMSLVEIVLITYFVTVEIEYPKVPLLQKFAALIAILRNSDQALMMVRILGSNTTKRTSLLKTGQKFQDILKQQREQLTTTERAVKQVIDQPIIIYQQEILKRQPRYQVLLEEQRKITEHVTILMRKMDYDPKEMTLWNVREVRVCAEMKEIEKDAWHQAETELSAAKP